MHISNHHRAWVAQRKWFHSIDFGGGLKSPARYPKRPANFLLYGVQHFLEQIDLAGQSCLDIGTVDGLTAFMLKARGAARVVATDVVARPTFEFGRDLLELDIDYRTPTKIDRLDSTLGQDRFDLIVNAGILYHVIDPIGSLLECRKRLKPGGLMIMETIHLLHSGMSNMYFIPNSRSLWQTPLDNFYWIPDLSSLEGMLELTSFDVLGYACSNERISLIARAVKPSQSKSQSRMIRRLLHSQEQMRGYNEDLFLDRFENETQPASSIQYAPDHYAAWIRPSRHRTALPYQPDHSHLSPRYRLRNRAIDSAMRMAYLRGRAQAAWRRMVFRR